MPQKSRRKFIRQSMCAAMPLTPLLNTLLNLKLAGAAAKHDQTTKTDYKALVCIFLSGGNDSWNMLLPADKALQDYHNTRGTLSLLNSGNRLLKLKDTPNNLHYSCKNLQNLYAREDLAFVANVGTLVEPTTIKSYKSRTARIPRALFSHSDQQQQWQTSYPQANMNSGWIGRAANVLLDTEIDSVASNISLAGNNLIQACGRKKCYFSISNNGSIGIRGEWKRRAIASLANPTSNSHYKSVFERLYANSLLDSMDSHEFFSNAYNSIKLKTQFDRGNNISGALEACAKTIGAREALGHKRQTFFLLIRGWDHHNRLILRHENLLSKLDSAIGNFFSALDELNISDNVTAFTASDFGRALASNGDGSDHGWGGNQFVVGGAVNGGRICGSYPDTFRAGSGLDVGANGRLLPTTSTDEYFSSLIQWFGVNKSNLEYVLPNADVFGALDSADPLNLFINT